MPNIETNNQFNDMIKHEANEFDPFDKRLVISSCLVVY